MVGDTAHDWHAAQTGGFDHFFVAGWGALLPVDVGSQAPRVGGAAGFMSLTTFADLAPATRRAAALEG